MPLISGSGQFESGFTLVELYMVYVPVVPVGCVEQGHFKEEIGRCSLETSYIPFVELITNNNNNNITFFPKQVGVG